MGQFISVMYHIINIFLLSINIYKIVLKYFRVFICTFYHQCFFWVCFQSLFNFIVLIFVFLMVYVSSCHFAWQIFCILPCWCQVLLYSGKHRSFFSWDVVTWFRNCLSLPTFAFKLCYVGIVQYLFKD